MMDPVLAHFIADWLFQSQWMASQKVNAWRPALVHVIVYGIVFGLIVRPSWVALAVIVGTHYLIDRYRLARHVNWAANWLAPRRRLTPPTRYVMSREFGPIGYGATYAPRTPPWSECKTYGSPPGVPDHIGFMVMIVVDQLLHLTINWATLRWLG